ncbi:MAG: MFS transporter [Cephaloticoccus sp.]|nr:MFS transporter [Cephaloticoccus sp.]MCF7759010.1 MFS transporter [Cephaloticoccus sp.]
MRLPNLLATKVGRLSAFFALYMTEGIPLGFTATAIATQMRRQGLGPAEIGAFVGTLYLPWAFKWVVGPFVDVLSSDRFGRRRMWIVLTQVMMVITLMAAMPVNFTTELKFFTFVIMLLNTFAATQDVAIDALAVNVLSEQERGLANGLMFAGAYLGQALGGSGVLFLIPFTGLPATYVFVAAVLMSVTLVVALPMREPKGPPRPPREGSLLGSVGREIGGFTRDAYRAFTGTRAAWVGVIFALLPAGAYGLSLALQSNLAVELGLDDNAIGRLALASTVISAVFCVAGGWLSDRFGRRRMLALYFIGTAIPGVWLAWIMSRHGWIMPIDPQLPDRPIPAAGLVAAFWTACLVFSVFQGLMYGTKAALFMDITTPAVAATQFTAYMAMSNFVISYSATWQGYAIDRFGYPVTLVADAAFGLVCILLLPFMVGKQSRAAAVQVPD